MDNVFGHRDRLFTRAICNHNMRGYVTGQVRIPVTQFPFANHYTLFVAKRRKAERSQLVE